MHSWIINITLDTLYLPEMLENFLFYVIANYIFSLDGYSQDSIYVEQDVGSDPMNLETTQSH